MTFQNVGNEKRAFDKALLSEPRGLWPRRAEIWWDRRLQDWKENGQKHTDSRQLEKEWRGFRQDAAFPGQPETLKGVKNTNEPGLNEIMVLRYGSKQLESSKKTFDKRTFPFGEH